MESHQLQQVEQGPKVEVPQSLQTFADLFVQRWNTFALQREGSRQYYRAMYPDGTPVPLTWSTIVKHLRGDLTIGLYTLNQGGKTSLSVIDGDGDIGDLLDLQDVLRLRCIPSYLEMSRRGGHVWVWWDRPVMPSMAQRILSIDESKFELYPSGNNIPNENGLGLLIRAPLGLHRAAGRRYPFVDGGLNPVSKGVACGQLEWLQENIEPVRVSDHTYMLIPTPEEERARRYPYSLSETGPISRWVAQHPIREVVGKYTDVSRSGMAHCPWGHRHRNGDKHKSFIVYNRTQKFWCFTERVGGNSFDFLCKHYNVTSGEMFEKIKGNHSR